MDRDSVTREQAHPDAEVGLGLDFPIRAMVQTIQLVNIIPTGP